VLCCLVYQGVGHSIPGASGRSALPSTHLEGDGSVKGVAMTLSLFIFSYLALCGWNHENRNLVRSVRYRRVRLGCGGRRTGLAREEPGAHDPSAGVGGMITSVVPPLVARWRRLVADTGGTVSGTGK
jgi:hypothetical protein